MVTPHSRARYSPSASCMGSAVGARALHRISNSASAPSGQSIVSSKGRVHSAVCQPPFWSAQWAAASTSPVMSSRPSSHFSSRRLTAASHRRTLVKGAALPPSVVVLARRCSRSKAPLRRMPFCWAMRSWMVFSSLPAKICCPWQLMTEAETTTEPRISSRRWLTARQLTGPGSIPTVMMGSSASPCSSSIRVKGTLYSPRAGSPPAEIYRILRVARPSTSSRPAVMVLPTGTGVRVHLRIRRISGQ